MDVKFYADFIRKGDSPEAVLDVVIGMAQVQALDYAANTILNEVRGMERGGSYARKKHQMYQGLARRVRECLDARDA